MRSTAGRVILGLALLVAAVLLLVVLKDDGDGGGEGGRAGPTTTQPKPKEKAAKPSISTIVVRRGQPVGGVAELSFKAGERIRFKVSSDTDEEIHVHGYDIVKDVEAGGAVTFDFPAEIEGVFEVELEGVGEPIAELEVGP